MKRWNREVPGRLAVLLASTLVLAACVKGDSEDQAMHNIGGTIAGLAGTIVLQNRGTDDLTLHQNGPFTFPAALKTGSAYAVSVAAQPVGQVCNVVHGTGTVTGEVADVVVTCFDNPGHALGGTVSGLVGMVVLRNGTESLPVDANGAFTFVYHVNEGAAYSVSVATQPVNQDCSVTNGTGTMPAADVTNVTVTCVDIPSPVVTYSIGGTVSGLDAGRTLQLGLQHSGDVRSTIDVTSNGPFDFDPAKLAAGVTYVVNVATQPVNQVCSVANGSGTMPAADVTNVTVTCADIPSPVLTYSIGGMVSGLGAGKTLQLGLQHSGDVRNTIDVTSNGPFDFDPARLPAGTTYVVSVATQPVNQACSVANGTGTTPAADVTNVTVTCVDIPPPVVTYSIGGTVSGLGAGTTLQLGLQHSGNLGSTIDVTANGPFNFDPDKVAAGETYVVSIATQPAGQTCSVSNGSGTANSNVTSVAVSCVDNTTTYSVGGTIAGLVGPGLRIENGVGNAVTASAGDTTFKLPEEFAEGAAYDVGVATQPAGQTCLITRSQGVITGADVTSIRATCVDNITSPLSGTYTVPALSAADQSHVYLTLFPDGVFIYANIENPKGCNHRGDGDGNGVEYGVYDYDAATGAFSIRAVVVDTNGRCGVWDGRSRFDGTLTLIGSGQDTLLIFNVPGGDAFEFSPVHSAIGQVYGSFADAYRRNFWVFLEAADNGVYFLNTETQADPDAAPTGRVAGLEYACGAINGTASTGTLSPDFSSTCITPADEGAVDTNGTSGLSHYTGSWEFNITNDTLTSSTFNGLRVVPD